MQLPSITFKYIFKLSASSMCRDFGPQVTQASVDKGCSYLGLGLSNICLSEEELPVQIGDVNSVHVNDMNVLRQRRALFGTTIQYGGPKLYPLGWFWGFIFSFRVETYSIYKQVTLKKKELSLKQWLVRSAKHPWNRTMLNLSEFRILSHQHRWPEPYSFLASSQWSQLLVRKHLHQRRDFFGTARDRHGRASGYPTQTWQRSRLLWELMDSLYGLSSTWRLAVRQELQWSQSRETWIASFSSFSDELKGCSPRQIETIPKSTTLGT